MVSAIEQKKEQRAKSANVATGKSSSDIIGFLKSLVNWVVGIILSIIIYVSFTSAYYNYNNEIDLPTDPNNYPYANPSMKNSILQHARQLRNIGTSASSLLKAKGKERITKMGLDKHLEKASEHINNIKTAAAQRGGSKNKLPYFYRKRDSFLSDWIADILIYSWSSLRENIAETLPTKSDNVSLEKLGFFSKALIFIGSPFIVTLGSIIVPLVGFFRTFYGVFGQSPTTLALLISIFFVIFPFPILAPVFFILALITGILQGGWFAYFFGLKGFMSSQPGTFKETARNFTHIISIMLGIGLISASSNLSSGASQGVTIGGAIIILLGLIDLVRKVSTQK